MKAPGIAAFTAWKVVDGVFVFYADGGEFSSDDHDRWLEAIKTEKYEKYLGATGEFIIRTEHRAPGRDYLAKSKVPFATITDSRLVRGAVTAGSWFGMNIAAFSWAKKVEAVAWLGLDAAATRRVQEALDELKASVDTRLAARARKVGT